MLPTSEGAACTSECTPHQHQAYLYSLIWLLRPFACRVPSTRSLKMLLSPACQRVAAKAALSAAMRPLSLGACQKCKT